MSRGYTIIGPNGEKTTIRRNGLGCGGWFALLLLFAIPANYFGLTGVLVTLVLVVGVIVLSALVHKEKP